MKSKLCCECRHYRLWRRGYQGQPDMAVCAKEFPDNKYIPVISAEAAEIKADWPSCNWFQER